MGSNWNCPNEWSDYLDQNIGKCRHLLLLWLRNYCSLNTVVSWLVNRKLIGFDITKLKWSRSSRVLTLCDPLDHQAPPSMGFFQARILEWVAISSSRRSSRSRDWNRVSRIVGRRFTVWATREVISPKLPFNRKISNHFLKPRCVSELSWNSLTNTNAHVLLLFFSRAPDVFLMSSHV